LASVAERQRPAFADAERSMRDPDRGEGSPLRFVATVFRKRNESALPGFRARSFPESTKETLSPASPNTARGSTKELGFDIA